MSFKDGHGIMLLISMNYSHVCVCSTRLIYYIVMHDVPCHLS